MKRSYIVLVCLFVFFAVSKTAQATATLQLINPPSPFTQDGFYVGPYAMSVNGVATTLVCDDFLDETKLGVTWTATVSTFSNLSKTQFIGQSNAVAKYDGAAWLVQQMYALNPKIANYGNEIMDMHFALWSIFAGASVRNDAPSISDSNSWYTAAMNPLSYVGDTFSNIVIYTPTTPGVAQEFMGETPEPATVALFGLALLAAVVVMRRRQSGLSGTLA
jgi:hypothetical protein